MWEAMVRGPIVHDESGRRRALSRPRATEFAIALILTAAAMIALYKGLDARNDGLFASGASFFSPRISLDDDIALVPSFVIVYYSYFPLLFFFSAITVRDRRLMYEGVIGYVGIAIIGFLFFWVLPSRMVQPDLSACTTASCRSLAAMYRVDNGFNIFPSMHVGYSTLVWLFFRRYMPELARMVGVLVLAIVLSTLLCKRHYIVDIPAAVVMALIVFAASQRYGDRLARTMTAFWIAWP
jgi:membrane-associated phospholipid phosphatase